MECLSVLILICSSDLYLVFYCIYFFFFKQKTAYEIKECDWSSDVCSSDLECDIPGHPIRDTASAGLPASRCSVRYSAFHSIIEYARHAAIPQSSWTTYGEQEVLLSLALDMGSTVALW